MREVTTTRDEAVRFRQDIFERMRAGIREAIEVAVGRHQVRELCADDDQRRDCVEVTRKMIGVLEELRLRRTGPPGGAGRVRLPERQVEVAERAT